MTQSFDEWFNKHHAVKTAYSASYIIGAKKGFEAGQQSRQTEVDGHIQRRMDLAKDKQDLLKERNELQKRIDEALTLIYSEKQAVECDKYKGVDADLIIGIGYELHLILKGTTNEQ